MKDLLDQNELNVAWLTLIVAISHVELPEILLHKYEHIEPLRYGIMLAFCYKIVLSTVINLFKAKKMGHIRLGNLPRTRKWQQVIGMLGEGTGMPALAAATMDASQRGLQEASDDSALIYSFWLLTQLPLAARTDDFSGELKKRGLKVSAEPTLMEIVGAFTDAVDDYVGNRGCRTDLGELAQLAAAETLADFIGEKSRSLFDTTPEDVKIAFKQASTTKNFGLLSREFFSRLTNRYISYYLSHEISNHVGSDKRLYNIDEHVDFKKALDTHCWQASRIVQEFSGGWTSKTNYEEGITPENVSGFMKFALKKIRAELAKGAKTNE